MKKITLDEYLEKMSRFAGSDYGKMVRTQFKQMDGESELAMLVAPSFEELEELKRAVAIMTEAEKADIENLNDEQVQRIAEDAKID